MNASARILKPTDFERLLRLYAKFEPKGAFMGLPPVSLHDTETWLHGLCNDCEQFVIELGDRIVGHSFLRVAPDKPEAEMGIFIHQDFRGLGLGRTLLLGMLNYGCKQLHLSRVWVKIDNSNSFGREVLERFGFYARDFNDVLKMELEMERPSNCAKCKGDRCKVYGKPLPQTLAVP